MAELWDPDAPGVLRLPSGRLVRGRGLRVYRSATRRPSGRDPIPPEPLPAFGLYLLGSRPPSFPWESRWVRWKDFWLPADPASAGVALREAWERAAVERVEVACNGGKGRTGTALACLAVLDGVPNADAVEFVRANYHRHAAETPWQRRFVARFPGAAAPPASHG
jgi:hypothetical protein